ncbi:MAG: hypothetical protein P1V35_09205 [Planctomycetota bacterium]|nr:hypothetical protein [Planctomycetota bacterium]
MAKDYILLKIDVERHTNGAEVAMRLRGTDQGGIPWMVITDSSGKPLITADRPTDEGPSNIGCPATKDEQAWFMTMVRKTKQHMSKGQFTAIEMGLAIYAKSLTH